jgi:hypothetical protein
VWLPAGGPECGRPRKERRAAAGGRTRLQREELLAAPGRSNDEWSAAAGVGVVEGIETGVTV